MSDPLTEAINEAVASLNEQLEKELRGAWRAGYDYVHVYSEPRTFGHAEIGGEVALTHSQYVLPTDAKRPPRPDALDYEYTYDIGSVPDDVIRKMLDSRSGVGYNSK